VTGRYDAAEAAGKSGIVARKTMGAWGHGSFENDSAALNDFAAHRQSLTSPHLLPGKR